MRLAMSQAAVPAAAVAARGAARRMAPPRVKASPGDVSRHARLAPPRAAAGSEPAAATGAVLSGNPLRPNETLAEAAARRAAETEAVEVRLKAPPQRVRSRAELDAALSAAGSQRVVMLEVVSDTVCDLDAQPRPEAQWKDDGASTAARMAPCLELRSGLQRVARDCPDVAFLSVNADEQPELAAELGVTVLPTVQFWRNGVRLWQTEGAEGGLQGSGEAVLYFGDYAANGVRASDFVRDVADRAALDALLAASGPGKLAVLNVSLATATPCVKIFPAFMALAKQLASVATFGRLIADGPGGAGAAALARELEVSHTPAFLFYRDGVEVGRHVGSSRGDLVGKILEMQGAFGVPPPPPPPRRRDAAPPQRRRASGQAMWR